MNPDGFSPSCDVGAHERCAGCSCGCHQDTAAALGGTAAVNAPGAGVIRHTAGVGSLLVWGRTDHRTLVQILSAAIPGAIALSLLVYCIVLTAQGLL